MPVDTKKEEEKTASEKIAQSSGDETLKYADQLEADSDKLINQLNEQREETGKKAEEQVDGLNKNLEEEEDTKKAEEEKKAKEEEGKKEEKEEKPDEKKIAIVDDEIKVDETDTIESLKDKLAKSEKRVQDNRTAFTKNKQETRDQEIATKAVVENLNTTIAELRTKTEEKATATTAEEKKIADKEVAKKLVNLDKQFETLKNVDPEIAEPLKQIIESLQDSYTSENTRLNTHITKLETELKNNTESTQKSAQQVADDKHYGEIEAAHSDWEAIVGSTEFDAYVESLSPRQKVLAKHDLDSGSSENIIELFDDYKKVAGITKEEAKEETKEQPDTTKTDAKTKKLKDAANLVNPVLNKSKEIKTDGTKIRYTRSMIKAMTPAEFAKHETDIDKELAAGRIPDR